MNTKTTATKLFILSLAISLLFSANLSRLFALDSTLVRIKLHSRNWAAKLHGVAGERTANDSSIATYDTRYGTHNFWVKRTGPYFLYLDRDGGTNWTVDTTYSGSSTTGKMFTGGDIMTLVVDSTLFDEYLNVYIPASTDDGNADLYFLNNNGDTSLVSLENTAGSRGLWIMHEAGQFINLGQRGGVYTGQVNVYADSLYLLSTTSTYPRLVLESDNDDGYGSYIYFFKDSDSPAAADVIGGALYKGRNSAAEEIAYSQWNIKIDDKTDASEDGQVEFYVMNGGSLNQFYTMDGTGNQSIFNIDNNDIDFDIEWSGGTALWLEGSTGNLYVYKNLTTSDTTTFGAYTTINDILEIVGDSLYINSTSSTRPFIVLENDNDDIYAPAFYFFKNTDSPAGGDNVGNYIYQSYDDGANKTTYHQVDYLIDNPTDGSEAGRFEHSSMFGGNLRSIIKYDGSVGGVGQIIFNDDEDDIDFYVKSDLGTSIWMDAGDGSVWFSYDVWITDTLHTTSYVDINANADISGNLIVGGNITCDSLFVSNYTVSIDFAPSHATVGGTAPTATTIGTSRGLAFDADAEIVFLEFEVPGDWVGTSNMELKVYWVPEAGVAMSNTETVKWDISYHSTAEGEAIDNGTQKDTTATYTQSGAGTDKELIETELILKYDDANQPLTKGDIVTIVFNRDMTADSYASDAVVQKWEIDYTSNTLRNH